MIPRLALPGMVERGRDTAITLDVYSDASAQQTASSATVTIYDGSEVVVNAAAATGLGPPATYTVTAATTADRSLSTDWLAVWTMTIGGTVYTFRQPLYLVRHVLYAPATDDDLTALHSDLDALRDSANMTSFEPYRTRAWQRIQRRLIAKGSRPQLVIDSWALLDLHVYESLAPLWRDFASSLGDSRYTELAEHYAAQAAAEWDSLVFTYDDDESGTIGGDERRTGSPVVFLNRPVWATKWRR